MASAGGDYQSRLARRVAQAADSALARQRYVAPVDILTALGWLHESNVDRWRRGRMPSLELAVTVDPERVQNALDLLGAWAQARGLQPTEADYPARSRHARELRFCAADDPERERRYRTHWVSPELPAAEHERQAHPRRPELVVISPARGSFTCTGCGEERDGLLLMEGPGPLCMSCADMDHLVFLAAGDAALTRRAKAASRLWAVVVRFSRARGRYERQGILVEEAALERAETQCLADAEARLRRRAREALRRADADLAHQARIAQEILRMFPGCPPERAQRIARHAGARGSGRVGRTATGRRLDASAIERALAAAIRHEDTDYDELLMSGIERAAARAAVCDQVARTIAAWRAPTGA